MVNKAIRKHVQIFVEAADWGSCLYDFLFLKATAQQIKQISVHVMKKKFLEVITNLRPSKKKTISLVPGI